jgi:hypothetical protein
MNRQWIYPPEHLMSLPNFSGVRVARSSIFYAVFCTSLFALLSFFFSEAVIEGEIIQWPQDTKGVIRSVIEGEIIQWPQDTKGVIRSCNRRRDYTMATRYQRSNQKL